MRQVIYRRAWCPQCEHETLQRDRAEYDAGVLVSEVVTCTECLLEVPA
jgi:hypothetical protein